MGIGLSEDRLLEEVDPLIVGALASGGLAKAEN